MNTKLIHNVTGLTQQQLKDLHYAHLFAIEVNREAGTYNVEGEEIHVPSMQETKKTPRGGQMIHSAWIGEDCEPPCPWEYSEIYLHHSGAVLLHTNFLDSNGAGQSITSELV